MKLWTVQKYEALNTILNQGVYQPDFSKSWYASQGEIEDSFYGALTEMFCNLNGIELPGLVFCFAKNRDNQYIDEFASYEEFQQFIASRKAAIQSLWKQIATPDACVLELEYPDQMLNLVNLMFIDINDFQALMPPVMYMPPYTREVVLNIMKDLSQGIVRASVFPTFLVQAHIPNIRKDNLRGVYPIFQI